MIDLHKQYNLRKSHCCKCGAPLFVMSESPLGSFFVMDKRGRYYCTKCDVNVDENDIYDEDEKEWV